ncbi:MAG: KilA-N domain-containing protein [Saprospiraceae bacterium]
MTDIARQINDRTDIVISNWLRNRNTVKYLGLWEKLHNPNFISIEFDGIKSQTGLNSFFLSAKQWIELTGASGIQPKASRYGGTFLV